jgi:hypothetical protein
MVTSFDRFAQIWHRMPDARKGGRALCCQSRPAPRALGGSFLFSSYACGWLCVTAGLQNMGTQAAVLALTDVIAGRVQPYCFVDPANTNRWAICLLVQASEAIYNDHFKEGQFDVELSGPCPTQGDKHPRFSPSYCVTAYDYVDLDAPPDQCWIRRKLW